MKTKLILLLVSVFHFALTKAQETAMSSAEITSFKQTVVAEAQKIKTLKTDFVQYKHLDFLSKEITSSGSMLLKNPNKLLWKYNTPIQYGILFKDNKVLVNDQGKKNKVDLGNNKKFEKINKMIIGSISGDLFAANDFTITFHKNRNQRIAKLSPKTKDLSAYIQTIILYFNDQQSTVSEVQLIEPSKDYTKIVFKNKQINQPISDASFSF
ncbi:LolA family protein [Sphingobacterium multivorum]|uniref:LolA family protein n=1 Tax=Sphingobacterium multivorum TaxID=28454 RepID=UPI00289F0FB3|nr:outer membrane lipoprotein carrier protein LolA [Sphingobacterium multivorum]